MRKPSMVFCDFGLFLQGPDVRPQFEKLSQMCRAASIPLHTGGGSFEYKKAHGTVVDHKLIHRFDWCRSCEWGEFAEHAGVETRTMFYVSSDEKRRCFASLAGVTLITFPGSARFPTDTESPEVLHEYLFNDLDAFIEELSTTLAHCSA